MSAERIVDEMELEAAAGLPISQTVQNAERADAFFKRPVASLSVDVFFRVTREGGDDFDAAPPKKIRQVFLAGLEDDGQVAAIHDVPFHADARLDEIVEVRIQLRRAACDVDGGDRGSFQELQNSVDGLARHHFFSSRSRFDVAVNAGLVAVFAHVHLQDVDRALAKLTPALAESLMEGTHKLLRHHAQHAPPGAGRVSWLMSPP